MRRCVTFFFFQAEDGIRDWSVTGVQTCALPIYVRKPLHGQKDIRRWFGRGLLPAERLTHIPESEVEPSTRIGRADGFGTEQVTDGAFEPDCRRMPDADTRILAVLARVADDGDIAGLLVEQRHMHIARVAPKPKQGAAAVRQKINSVLPAGVGDNRARPGTVAGYFFVVRDIVQ